MGERQLEKASCWCRCVRELDLEAEFGVSSDVEERGLLEERLGLKKEQGSWPWQPGWSTADGIGLVMAVLGPWCCHECTDRDVPAHKPPSSP